MTNTSGREAIDNQVLPPTSKKISAGDDSAREKTADLEKRLAFEGLIVEFSAQLLRLPISGFEESLDPWLQRFAQALDVDRVSLMAFLEGHLSENFARHYIKPGIIPLTSDFVPRSIPVLDDILKRDEVINWSRIPEDLPDDLSIDDVPFLKENVKSFLAIPMTAGGAVIGFSTFGTYRKEIHWTANLIQRLRFLNEIIAYTLMRKRDHIALLEEMERRRRLEERNTAVLKSAGLGFWIIDIDGNIKEVNDAYCRMVGYDRDEILSMRIPDFDINHSQDEIEKTRETIRKRGEFVFESRQRRKDGSIVDLEVSSAMMPLENEIFTFFRDITSKKRQDRLFYERFRFETLITEFSTALSKVRPGLLVQELSNWLQTFAEFLGVERCVVVEYDRVDRSPWVLQSYHAPGLTSSARVGSKLPFFAIRDYLCKEGYFNWERIPEDMPNDLDLSDMLLVKEGAKSCLAISLESEDDVIGGLLFISIRQYRKWSDSLLRRLRLVAQILSGAMAKERAYQAMERRYQFERLVSELSAAILERAPVDLNEVITYWLERIATFLKVDRASIVEFSDNLKTVTLTYNYMNPEVQLSRSLGELVIHPQIINAISRGEILRFSRLPDDLPDGIDPDGVKFVQDGTKSFLSVPLIARDIVLGALSIGTFLQSHTWQNDEVSQIQLIGEIIAGAILRKRSHLALVAEMKRRREVEERNTTILNATVVGFWITNLSGHIVEVNNAYCHMVGYSRDELLSMHVNDLDNRYEDPSKVEQFVRQLADKGSAVIETRHRCKDGSYVDLEISNTQLSDNDQVISFFRDVTAIKKAGREIAERLEFETLLSDFSAALIRLPAGGLAEALNIWLKRLALFLDIDRCVVSEYHPDSKTLEDIQVYASPGLPDTLADRSVRSAVDFQQTFKHGEVLKYDRIPEDLPAGEPLFDSLLLQEGTKSFLAIPLGSGTNIIGIIAFGAVREAKSWPDDILRRLQLTARILTNALLREHAFQAVEQRLEFEHLVSGFSADLMEQSPDELDDVISIWLTKISIFLQVDRLGVAEFMDDKNRLRILYDYFNPDLRTARDLSQQVINPVLISPLLLGETINISSIPNDLPAGIDPDSLNIVKEGTKSFLCVPLKARNSIIGTLSIGTISHERTFQDDQISQIRLLGDILAGALLRKQDHETLLQEMARRRRVEERNTLILKSASIGFVISDLNGNIEEVNDAFCRLVGYGPEELSNLFLTKGGGKAPESKVSESEVRRLWQQLLSEGVLKVETSLRHKDGGWLDVEISSTLIPAENRVISFITDVTGIKTAQREVEERLTFETFVSEFSAAMIRLPIGGLAAALKPWLERLAQYVDVDRCVVSRYSHDLSQVRALQAYSSPGLAPIPLNTDFVPSFGFQKYLARGRIIKFDDFVEELPDDDQLRNSPIAKDGTKSLMALALESGDAIIGLVTFGSIHKAKHWSEETVRRLKLVTQVISNALMREEAADDLAQRLSFEELLSGCSTALINLPIGDFEKALSVWLEKFVQITGVDHVSVNQIDEDATTFSSVSTYTVMEIDDPPPPEHHYKPPRSVLKRLLNGENIYFDRIPDRQPLSGNSGVGNSSRGYRKTLLVIPLMTQGELIGSMAFSCYRSYLTFSEEQVRLLRLLGEIVANFLSRRQAELELKVRLDFEALISEFSAALINMEVDELNATLGKWIRRLVEFLDVDRGNLIQYNDNQTQFRLIQTYSAPFLPSLSKDEHSRPVMGYLSDVRNGEAIIWERIPSGVPDNLGFDELGLGSIKTKSVLILPLEVGGAVIGALLFSSFREHKKWSSDLVVRLKLVGEIIANALLRSRAELQLSAYKEHLEDLIEARTAELKAAQKDLVQSEKLATLGKLTATVSHELRNPLGTIRSSLYSISRRVDDQTGPIRRAVERAERGIIRCDRIVEELLGYTRTPSLELAATHIDKWLDSILDEEVLPEGIQDVRDFHADVKIDIDRERLQRCIINIVANSVQAIEQAGKAQGEGRLVISTAIANGSVEIVIEDNGVGIPSENIEKIFEPLFSTKNFGVGLGVPIARQVIEQHGGAIIYQSEPGIFTKAIIRLPLKMS